MLVLITSVRIINPSKSIALYWSFHSIISVCNLIGYLLFDTPHYKTTWKCPDVITALTEVRLCRWTEHLKLLHRGLALVCSFGLCGQDTCLLCLLSVWLSMPGVEHTVTHTICYLRHSWLGQTRVWVGNGADKTSDLDTVSYVWSTQRERAWQREREVDWWELVVLLILVCVRKAAESHVAWKPVYLCVWWETGSFTASLILFNFKDKHQITSLNKCFF